MNIRTVTVIGANGSMGRNVAAIFASFGSCTVYLMCRDIKKAQETVSKAVRSVRADSIAARLIPVDFSSIGKCVGASDLVIEQVKEDMTVKSDLIHRIGMAMRPDTIVCSGTSGLSITTLAECLPENYRGNFFGVHMFNPPYSMTLCELIPTKYNNDGLLDELKQYLSGTLLRTVVGVKDCPAFLGNRIGFMLINEAIQYAEKYKDNGGVDYIDAILGSFTGRAMAPIRTADFVGLDVHKSIVDNVYKNSCDIAHESFKCPECVLKLTEEGNLGSKVGKGLYFLKRFDNGTKQVFVYDIASGTYREQMNYTFPFAETMIKKLRKGSYKSAFDALLNNHSCEAEICVRFLLRYIVYSISTAEEIGFNISAADDVMATGFNWCPPLALFKALSDSSDFNKLVKERLELPEEYINHIISLAEPSKYDYRTYFKAKR